jgi:succinyl-CoA synthetase beta subunit
MKLLLSDKNVKVVLINIFGGITRCDDVAKGLLEAFEQLKTNVPVVIRLTGTNEKEGRALLKDTDLHVAKTMSKAARLAVELAEQQQK